MALRSGSLLGGLLMGAAGGLKGYAQQEEMRKAEAERERERKRLEMQDRIRLLEAGATEMEDVPEGGITMLGLTPGVGPVMNIPKPVAQAMPSRSRNVVTVGDRNFRIPTTLERTERELRMRQGLAEGERESNNLRAYNTLRTAFPESDAGKRPYSPLILYDKEYTRLSGERENAARIAAQARLSGQEKQTEREAQKNAAMAWYEQNFGAGSGLTPEQRSAAGDQFVRVTNMLRSQGKPATPADVALAILSGELSSGRVESADTLAQQRAAAAAKMEEEVRMRRQRTLEAGGAVPNAGQMAQAPAGRPGMPGRPGATPTVPMQERIAQLKAQGYTKEQARATMIREGYTF